MAVGKNPTTQVAVHLHVRGENISESKSAAECVGSSPRAWRKYVGVAHDAIQQRFISTCVEKICVRHRRADWKTVHLHVRGENDRRKLNPQLEDGSSPRAWRKCHRRNPFPAAVTVHLHVRGENERIKREGY